MDGPTRSPASLKRRRQRDGLLHLPKGLSSRLLWYFDATDRRQLFGPDGATPIRDGDTMGLGLAKKGNYHLTQATSSAQATWLEDCGVGQPGLVFGSDDYYSLTSSFPWPSSSFLVVAVTINSDNSGITMNNKTLLSGETGGFDFRWTSADFLDCTKENSADLGSSTGALPFGKAGISAAYFQQGLGGTYYINGASAGPITGSALSLSTHCTTVGKYSGGSNQFLFGTLLAFAVFSIGSGWTADELAALWSFLEQ